MKKKYFPKYRTNEPRYPDPTTIIEYMLKSGHCSVYACFRPDLKKLENGCGLATMISTVACRPT
jgi:hypothetical protein